MTEDAAPTYGSWRLIGSADATRKRSIVRCLTCGSVRTVNTEMLMTGHVACSGCTPPLNVDHHAHTIASEAASLESRSARKRQHGVKD
jgi:hypothetical protein